jgi:hypothetical protein
MENSMDLWQLAGLYLLFITFFTLGAGLAHLVATAIRKFRGKRYGGMDRWNAD